jgi:hypothetical protein
MPARASIAQAGQSWNQLIGCIVPPVGIDGWSELSTMTRS